MRHIVTLGANELTEYINKTLSSQKQRTNGIECLLSLFFRSKGSSNKIKRSGSSWFEIWYAMRQIFPDIYAHKH